MGVTHSVVSVIANDPANEVSSTAWNANHTVNGGIRVDYESQTGDIATPSTTPLGNGHIVIIYNSTVARHFWCTYSNSTWKMVEVL